MIDIILLFRLDIDECSGSNPSNDCAETGGVCINTHGSYKCKCEKGYKGNGKQCTDINECVEHDCDQGDCQNTQGSFRCDCFSGYAMNAERVCVDVDECEIGNNTCEAIPHSYCVNLEKFLPEDEGYRCKCETGYKKLGKSCVFEGNMKEWIKFLAIIIGGFVGILFLIILCAVIFSKWRNRTPKSEKKDEVVVAPVGLAPPVDFAYLDMPQTQQTGQDEDDWKELEDEDVEDDDED
ncbi:Hemicentin-1 [Stylophora pistillata]|uniref:Hemicentin-1 n=1 Tax=Stylophora pistillata TaxID=50429 RepID=A0A2B4RWW1_STYPI|nr:Hemicentin-1 [Stylophora pistillata]